MDKLYEQAKAFLKCMKIRIIRNDYFNLIKPMIVNGICINPYSVTITNPRNGLEMNYIMYRNDTISDITDNLTQKMILMDVLLDHLYKTNSNPGNRNQFIEIFNEDDVMLMIAYFKYLPCFKKAVISLSG